MNIFITQKIPICAKKILKAAGHRVTGGTSTRNLSNEELLRGGKKADAVLSLLSDRIDAEVIAGWNECKVIANYAVGYNNIDVTAAKARGITVTNTPDVLTDATADLAIGLLLALARHIPAGDRFMREDRFTGWGPLLFLGTELRGKTFGIAGAGRIGQATAKRAAAFGCSIVYFSKTAKPAFEAETGATRAGLTELFSTADILSVHLPLTEATRGIISASVLGRMKPEALFINTARGEVTDEQALLQMLRHKRLRGAALDVYHGEPDWNRELAKLDNVVLAPHIGSATYEARDAMAALAAKNILAVLAGRPPLTAV